MGRSLQQPWDSTNRLNMHQYRPSTLRDGLELINNLREEDRDELLGTGHTLLHIPFGVVTSEHATTFFSKKGELAGCAGISPGVDGQAMIWMLCTPVITQEVFTFVRQAKKWLAKVEPEYKLLWNLADARNHVHHKLLKHLGFRALRAIPVGPEQLPYYEIVKLCAYH